VGSDVPSSSTPSPISTEWALKKGLTPLGTGYFSVAYTDGLLVYTATHCQAKKILAQLCKDNGGVPLPGLPLIEVLGEVTDEYGRTIPLYVMERYTEVGQVNSFHTCWWYHQFVRETDPAEFGGLPKDIKESFAILKLYMEEAGFGRAQWDCHWHNIGRDSRGEMVIFDPVAIL
jgi:hypothetical protein